MDEISPPTLKGYRMCGALGTGGGSVIYAIDEIKTGKRFALKYVERLSARHARFFEQVTAEHNLAKNVKHPVLRKTFKLERRGLLTTNAMLLYMDFVDGRPLTALQHSDASRALLALAKAAEGLRASHHAGIEFRRWEFARKFSFEDLRFDYIVTGGEKEAIELER
ncbi:MAG: hypothetical protein IIA27_14605, partial [Gemmatimonadetes bacterium]|nr:hypothetical protein [Gemmatimonadota bacterium]